MSPWMLAYRASEDAFAQIDGHVAQYMAHWFDIVGRGVSAETIASSTTPISPRVISAIATPSSIRSRQSVGTGRPSRR